MPIFSPLEGFLFKKNSKGEWKKRFCSCKQHSFVGYKENSTHEIKENVDYKDIVRVIVGKNEKSKATIEIEVKTGEKLVFQTDRAKDWADGLEIRADWFAQFGSPSPTSRSPCQSSTKIASALGESDGEHHCIFSCI
jgi:hypothetical protein